jgi:hypothetical protein
MLSCHASFVPRLPFFRIMQIFEPGSATVIDL